MRIERVLVLLLLLCVCSWAGKLPTKPAADTFLADYANVMNHPDTKASMVANLKKWNGKSKSRIYLVTVTNLSSFGLVDVESGARQWCSAWGLDQDDVLLLLSVGDRKARIQLGSGWDTWADAKADQIMRDVIVPACKTADYPLALYRGANALHELTEVGPAAAVRTDSSWPSRLESGITRNLPYCVVPWPFAVALFLLGIVCFAMGALGLVKDGDRATMFATSAMLLLGTAFSGILIAVVVVGGLLFFFSFLPNSHHHCHSSYGWDSSSSSSSDGWFGGSSDGGGSSSGGSDWGGGGSTGSW